MLRKLVAALAWLSLLATPVKLKAQIAKEAPSLVAFPEVGVAMPQPPGFEKAEDFYGFQQPSTGASVMVLAIPGPFAEVTQGFTKTALAERGMTLHAKELTRVKGQAAWFKNSRFWVTLPQQNKPSFFDGLSSTSSQSSQTMLFGMS